MTALRNWIYASLDANHLLCAAALYVSSMIVCAPFLIAEQLLQGVLAMVPKE